MVARRGRHYQVFQLARLMTLLSFHFWTVSPAIKSSLTGPNEQAQIGFPHPPDRPPSFTGLCRYSRSNIRSSFGLTPRAWSTTSFAQSKYF